MIKRFISLFLLIPTIAFAQPFGGGGPFPDNLTVRNNGTLVDGTGKIVDFRDNISVTYDSLTFTYHIAGSAGGSVSDAIYGVTWDGITTVAPSKNAVYDKIETLGAGSGDPILIDTVAVTDASGVDLQGGAGVDITFNAAVSPDTASFIVDATELEALTWGAGGNASNIWTFNLSGTDHTMTASSGLMSFSHDIAVLGDNIEATTETDRFVFMANGSTYAPEAIDLGTDTTGGYAGSSTEGGAATTATALAADPADCATSTHFAVGVVASGVATCEAIADADVPNTITIDLATTATTANAGDSATSFFPSGTLEVAIGGTGTTTSTGTGAVVLGTTPTFTTSVIMPQGAAPTVGTAGNIAVDTTTDQLQYFGGAKRTLPYSKEICVTLETPVDADDNIMFFQPRHAITITDVVCRVDGGTSIPLTISDGTNALEAITCATTATEDDGSIANGTFTALERMEFDLGTPTGTQTWLNFCVTYTVDAD